MAKLYSHEFWTSDDGLELHYRDYRGPDGADKAPVICLHGLTRNARDFAPLAAKICAKRRVLVPEMRGRGRSAYAPDSSTYSPKTYIADVFKLLADLGIEQVLSVGTSMGGLMTMLMAAERPKLFTGAVINDIGPQLDPAGLSRIGGYVGQGGSFPSWMHAARALRAEHSGAFPDYGIDQWLEMAKRTLIVAQNGRISYDYDMAIAEPFKQPGNAAPPDMWLAFEALNPVPIALIRGGLSDLLSEDVAGEMVKRHGDCTLATVPRIGHAPMLDEPEALAAIEAVLERAQ
jgi:pimeloyl-ACP methyl ester carboxylesterase